MFLIKILNIRKRMSYNYFNLFLVFGLGLVFWELLWVSVFIFFGFKMFFVRVRKLLLGEVIKVLLKLKRRFI